VSKHIKAETSITVSSSLHTKLTFGDAATLVFVLNS
jgi:hypothetical protein